METTRGSPLSFPPFANPFPYPLQKARFHRLRVCFFYLRVFEAHLNTYLFGEFDNSEQYKKTRMNIVVYYIFTVEFSDSGNNYIPPAPNEAGGVTLFVKFRVERIEIPAVELICNYSERLAEADKV